MTDDTLESNIRVHVESLENLRATHEAWRVGRSPVVSTDALAPWVAGNLCAMARTIAPRFARAVLARPSMIVRFPLDAGPAEGEEIRSRAMVLSSTTWVTPTGSFPHDLGRTDPDPAPVGLAADGTNEPTRIRLIPHSQLWPKAITPLEVLHALRASEVPEAVLVADSLSERDEGPEWFGWGDPFFSNCNHAVRRVPRYTLERFKDHPVMVRASWRRILTCTVDGCDEERPMTPEEAARWFVCEMELRWRPLAVAHLLDVVREIRKAAENARPIPLPANKASRGAMGILTKAGSVGTPERAEGRDPTLRLAWGGRPQPLQLQLRFDKQPEETVLCGILNELREDGLRDYLVLHRMAAEQGRTGKMVWTWREHRERTAYAERVKNSIVRDARAMADTTTRLRHLARAELRLEHVLQSGKVEWRRLGPFGLIDIPAGLDADNAGNLERATIELNPVLYRGAAVTRESKLYFTQLSDAALCLPGHALRLATMLVFRYRHRRDHGGSVRVAEPTLFEYASVQRGGVEHAAKARATLTRALDDLKESSVVGEWSREDDDYIITPPQWWIDQVVHQVPPELRPPRRDLPRCGKDLRRWRQDRRLSQTALATSLGVNRRTIIRAEDLQDATIEGTLADALAEWSPSGAAL